MAVATPGAARSAARAAGLPSRVLAAGPAASRASHIQTTHGTSSPRPQEAWSATSPAPGPLGPATSAGPPIGIEARIREHIQPPRAHVQRRERRGCADRVQPDRLTAGPQCRSVSALRSLCGTVRPDLADKPQINDRRPDRCTVRSGRLPGTNSWSNDHLSVVWPG